MRRRVRGDQLGVLFLDGAQLGDQRVVLGVGDHWVVEHVVAVPVEADLLSELLKSVLHGHLPSRCHARRAVRSSSASIPMITGKAASPISPGTAG